jgi:hypothetical protein
MEYPEDKNTNNTNNNTNDESFLDDLISSALEDLEVLEKSGHFDSNTRNTVQPTPTPQPNVNGSTSTSTQSDDDLIDQMMKEFDSNSGYQGLIQGMMKQLLSKDVLYEPMKEMRDKYPQWLQDNKEKLSREDWNKYLLQFTHIEEIIALYEKDGEKDFDRILKLMREVQECGHVPAEIVKQLAPDVEFDEEGQPKFPGLDTFGNLDATCSLM